MTLEIVNSFNEWDPLEEVIVGTLEGGCELPWEKAFEAVIPQENIAQISNHHLKHGGKPQNSDERIPAQKELDEFVHILKAEGVIVQRPEAINWAKPYSTIDWASPDGNAQTCPRDVLITIGNEIIEAPMSWRSRYF